MKIAQVLENVRPIDKLASINSMVLKNNEIIIPFPFLLEHQMNNALLLTK